MPVFSGTAAADRIVGSAAADELYGLGGDDKLYGVGGNDWLVGGLGADLMAGGLGDDSYDVDSVGDQVVEYAGEGVDRVRAWISYQLTANVETLTLAGTADLMGTGNALANTIVGNAGNNVLNGSAGDDLLVGGKGDDVYDVDSAGDKVAEAAGEGHDRVRSLVSWQLGANIEDLTLGGTADLMGTGNALANTIIGNAGNNVLNGSLGDDLLIGRAGNDVYDVDSAGDKIQESWGEGHDRVRSLVSWQLGANVEDLTLGGTGDLTGSGNALANTIIGNAGNNVLDGGAGDDLLIGRAGNDEYEIDSSGDQVRELAGEGTDLVRSSVSYALGANVENLILMEGSGISGLGNGLDNTITGNSFANVLNGGAGADTLIGGMGDDVYDVDSEEDAVVEQVGGGRDRVRTSLASYDLAANVEDLTLTGGGRHTVGDNVLDNEIVGGGGIDYIWATAGKDILYGNGGNDRLLGGAGDDTLSGGAGNDEMFGGDGNDIYDVDSTGETIEEAENGGYDRVRTLVSYTLVANVEELNLVGSGHIDGTGNGLANTIVGNFGDNVLDGGAGDDLLIGGWGGDTYIVDSAGDKVVESAEEGHDLVVSVVNYQLGANLEELILAGSANISGIGNDMNNSIRGNSGNNILNGGSGEISCPVVLGTTHMCWIKALISIRFSSSLMRVLIRFYLILSIFSFMQMLKI